MKTFDELTKEEQERAIEQEMSQWLEAILVGAFCFDDEANGDTLQAAIDDAIARANRMRTPWFAGEYVMDARYNPGEGHITEDDGLWPVSAQIRSLAVGYLQDATFYGSDEKVIALC
jgi:hypothetical protein